MRSGAHALDSRMDHAISALIVVFSVPISALIVVFSVPMALWPFGWLYVLIRHALARRWQHVGRVALLLPLWTIAASIGAVQLGGLLGPAAAAGASPRPLIAATSIAIAFVMAVMAWGLLVASFRNPQRPIAQDH
jgi:hypothetical protein